MTAGESARVDVFVAGRGLYGSSATADAPEVPSPGERDVRPLDPRSGARHWADTADASVDAARRLSHRRDRDSAHQRVLVRRDAVLTLQVRPRVGAPPPTQVTCSGANVAGLASTVYVSPQGNDGPGCGASSSAACATIQRGIDTCSSPGCSVLVRYGLYTTSATITLRDGVSVHGSCAFGDGASTAYRTVIAANPAPGTPAIAATSINSPTSVSGLVVVGKEETEAGTASIAMAIASSKGLVLTQSVLASGRGGDGTSRETRPRRRAAREAPSQDGANGGSGGPSCPANPAPGGGGGDGNLSGGNVTPFGCNPDRRRTDGQASGDVAGGAGGTTGGVGLWCPGRSSDAPGAGQSGSPGNPGRVRPSRSKRLPLSAGSLTGTTWTPSQGDDGQAGRVGSGGGGGGAGGACIQPGQSDGAIPFPGLAGGGGGGGGCGGGAGSGGQQGGASIALVVNGSPAPDPALNAIIPGPGGNGGDAGSATSGGPGGGFGYGNQTGQTLFFAYFCGGVGADGRAGGYGGAGSAGAAGHGGPSLGMALIQAAPPSNTRRDLCRTAQRARAGRCRRRTRASVHRVHGQQRPGWRVGPRRPQLRLRR